MNGFMVLMFDDETTIDKPIKLSLLVRQVKRD